VCNPPYIRVHDWESNLEGYEFVEQGMKDMYLAFYELGLRQTNRTGVMCYITPSSWFTSTAGKKLREHLFKNRLVDEIYDYGHTQVFENATTYVEITVIKPLNARIHPDYVIYGSVERGDKKLMIPYDNIELNGKFYFTEPSTNSMLEEINTHHSGNIKVKNGYATLADDIFIDDVPWFTGHNAIPVIKSSTGNWSKCIYPYDEDGKLVSEDLISEQSPLKYKWLCENRERLEARATTEPWYAFGRTQAINDTYKDKWAIKSIVKTLSDINPIKAPAGTGVYGGLYILCDSPEQLECLKTEEFLNYVKALKKYKSGGYYTFSSKDLENYLNWYNYNKRQS
jgi:adenine-specific DNA-methyltransferase